MPPDAKLAAPNSAIMGSVTTTSTATYAQAMRSVKRPDPVAVGTIVWLGSEVMFFAGLFAIYFTLRSTSPELWAQRTQQLNVPYATVNTIVLVLSSVTCQMGVFAAERFQPYSHQEARLARLGHGRVVLAHLRAGRDLRVRPGVGVRAAGHRGDADQRGLLRVGLLPHDRLPRAARHGRPHRLPARASAAHSPSRTSGARR